LALNQKNNVNFEIHSLPIIKNMAKVDTKLKMFKLLDGKSSETSGGLFMILPKDNAEKFCEEFEKIDGKKAWIIGEVVKGEKKAIIKNDFKVIDV
jgi:selenide,water dikinase